MYILCDFNLFDLRQNIMLVRPDGVEKVGISSLDELGDNIAFICEKYNVSNVKLKGNKRYADAIAENIIAAGNTRYGMFNIEVEVM